MGIGYQSMEWYRKGIEGHKNRSKAMMVDMIVEAAHLDADPEAFDAEGWLALDWFRRDYYELHRRYIVLKDMIRVTNWLFERIENEENEGLKHENEMMLAWEGVNRAWNDFQDFFFKLKENLY